MSEAFRFGTKAETLDRLRPLLRHAVVPPQIHFTARTWRTDPGAVLAALHAAGLAEASLAVRSSALGEDGSGESHAGEFTSVLHVPGAAGLADAVERVLASYGGGADPLHQVLVQPMVAGVVFAGVAFTADLDTLTAYDVVSYTEGADTDVVTSGRAGDLRTWIHFRGSPAPIADPRLAALVAVLRECEAATGHAFLDLEFAIDDRGTLHVLQLRRLATAAREPLVSEDALAEGLRKIHKKLEKLSRPHPHLLGDRLIYGVMPDWNPAEIVGTRPRTLALSLYRNLVTDSIWAYQRDNYGYRNLRSHPLLRALLGVPYVDVRCSFNSFIPKSLHESIARKLANHYLDRLAASPHHHDKVEFEVVHSCYYLNLPERLEALAEHGFSAPERRRIEFSLLELTNRVIGPTEGHFRADLQKVDTLAAHHAMISASELPIIDRIYWLVEDCKRFGTLPFAGIARAAFMAVQFLRSFVEVGILTEAERDAFMKSLSTVSKELATSLHDVARGRLSREAFLERFGHLRPGTYDILSPRYDENFDGYFDLSRVEPPAAHAFTWTDAQLREIERRLVEHGIRTTPEELIAFIRAAIEGRESSKFVFTRSLSDALRLLEEFGLRHGLSKDDVSHLDVHQVLDLYVNLEPGDLGETLRASIARNRAAHRFTEGVRLPDLVLRPDDVYAFELPAGQPNFVTRKSVRAPVCLDSSSAPGALQGAIAFVPSADPGYDYLFTKGIAGLVTQFGGVNSHMAIRCAELGLPAVIGANERNFRSWSRASVLHIDCAARSVSVVS